MKTYMTKYIIFIWLIFINPAILFSKNKMSSGVPGDSIQNFSRKYTNETFNYPPASYPPSKGDDNLMTFLTDSLISNMKTPSLRSEIKKFPNMDDIDLSDPNKWISQYTQPRPKRACYRTSLLILKKYNTQGGELGKIENIRYANGTYHFSNTIQVAVQLADGSLKGTGRQQEGIDYIDWQISRGNPVIVGLDDNNRRAHYNYDNTTEHFVVITGRLTDEEGVYYRFFEVAAHSNLYEKENIGVTNENKLRLTDNKLLVRDKVPNSSHKYTVVQIRKNK